MDAARSETFSNRCKRTSNQSDQKRKFEILIITLIYCRLNESTRKMASFSEKTIIKLQIFRILEPLKPSATVFHRIPNLTEKIVFNFVILGQKVSSSRPLISIAFNYKNTKGMKYLYRHLRVLLREFQSKKLSRKRRNFIFR